MEEGTIILSWINKSPNATPLPLIRNLAPLDAPAGTLTVNLEPSITGTSILVPRIASEIEIGTSTTRLSPYRLKKAWGADFMVRYKFPPSWP